MEALPQLIEGLITLNIELAKHTPEIIQALIEAIPEIIDAIVEAFAPIVDSMLELGGNMIKGIWEGISNFGEWLWNQISGFFGGIIDNIKAFFGIHSPSTLFRDMIGKNLVIGLADGISSEGDAAVDAMLDIADDIANVEFKTGEVDFDSLSDKMTQAVDAEVTATARDISSTAIPASAYGSSDDDDSTVNDDGSDQPGGMIETNIYIDGKKTARAITPYVAKELDWEDK
jgi:phage-related protein